MPLLHPLTTIHFHDCEEQLQQTSQEDPLNLSISSSEFSGYEADFHEGTAPSEHGRGTARQVRISTARHGRVTVGAGRGMGTPWYV
jgi:hypothetical protein